MKLIKTCVLVFAACIISCTLANTSYSYSELRSAISALKILTGEKINYPEADMDGNGKVEMNDAVFALQIAAGFKAGPPDIILLTATNTDTIKLAWIPVSNALTSADEMKYEVHLSIDSGFEPSANTLKATIKGEAQTDIIGLETETTYYAKIVAVDKERNRTVGKGQKSISTFTLPPIESSTVKFDIDQNLGLENAVQDGTTYSFDNKAGATPPEIGSILFIKVGEDTCFRRIDTVHTTTDNIFVQTSDAELSEVLTQATVNTKFTLFEPEDAVELSDFVMKKSARSDGSRQTIARWKDDFLVAEQIDNTGETDGVSVKAGSRSGEYRDRLKKKDKENAGVNASIIFTPELETKVAWEYDLWQGIKITDAEVIARGTLSASIEAFYNFKAAGSVEKEIPFPLFTRTYRSYYLLGGVPVYQRIIFTVKAVLNAEASAKIEANAEAKASSSLEFGMRYNSGNGEWEKIPPSSNFEKSFTADVDVKGSVYGEVRLIPNIRVEFYRVAATDISIEPFLAGDIKADTIPHGELLLYLARS